MKIVNFTYPDDLKLRYFPSSVMAIGFFDSVHLGHQRVINTAKEIANKKGLKLAAMTFFPHPKEVLSNGKNKVNYLTPLSEKIKSLSNLGVEICYLVNFNKEFSNMPPKKFVHECIVKHNVKHVVAGFDFSYGRRGEGNMNRLREDGEGNFDVTTVAKIAEQNNKISSTLIREKIMDGKVDEIPSYLGNYYKTKGTIEDIKVFENTACLKIVQKQYYLFPKSGYYHIEIADEANVFNGIAYVNNDQYINVFVKQSASELLERSISICWVGPALSDEFDNLVDLVYEKARMA